MCVDDARTKNKTRIFPMKVDVPEIFSKIFLKYFSEDEMIFGPPGKRIKFTPPREHPRHVMLHKLDGTQPTQVCDAIMVIRPTQRVI